MVIKSLQNVNWIGNKWCHMENVDSTSRRMKELAEGGCPHGTLITADGQEAGVGRRGRTWVSEPGKGIYASFLLRPMIPVEKASMLTLVTAVAVAKAIEMVTGDGGFLPFIKWPNDIVIRGKKVAGILTELSVKNGNVEYVIIGIGVNVYKSDFPRELAEAATSLEAEAGRQFSREALLEMIMQQFEHYYQHFTEDETAEYILTDYQKYLANKGRKVKVLDPKGEYEGTARGINQQGELIVDTAEGTRVVSGGEVSVRGIYGYV